MFQVRDISQPEPGVGEVLVKVVATSVNLIDCRHRRFGYLNGMKLPAVGRGSHLLTIFLGFTQGIIGIISGTLVILFLGLNWSANRTHFQQPWLSLLPPGARKYIRDILRTVEGDFGRCIRAELFQSMLVGVLLRVGYWALGSPYPALLAVIGAIANLIREVGVRIAIFTPLLIGLFSALLTALTMRAIKPRLKPRARVAGRAGAGAANQVIDLKERHMHLSAQIAAWST